MQTGRGGMGNSKHRKAGHPSKNARYKAELERDANKLLPSPTKPPMFKTVAEAIEAQRKNRPNS